MIFFFIVKLRTYKVNIDREITVSRTLVECCCCVVRESVTSQRLIMYVHLIFHSINLPHIFIKNNCFKVYFKDKALGTNKI